MNISMHRRGKSLESVEVEVYDFLYYALFDNGRFLCIKFLIFNIIYIYIHFSKIKEFDFGKSDCYIFITI